VEAEIPANTTASVTLPGAEDGTYEIGSGSYRWSYPYQAPEVVHHALTLDSTVGELIDNPVAHARVMNIVFEHNPEFADRMNGQTEVTLREATLLNPNPDRLAARIEVALASIAQGN
jgi:hypothetical protein